MSKMYKVQHNGNRIGNRYSRAASRRHRFDYCSTVSGNLSWSFVTCPDRRVSGASRVISEHHQESSRPNGSSKSSTKPYVRALLTHIEMRFA